MKDFWIFNILWWEFQRRQSQFRSRLGHNSKMTGGDPLTVDFVSRLYHLAQARGQRPKLV